MAAYDELYSSNRGLLYYWANRYKPLCADRPAVDVNDLVQAGFLGLCKASATYQPDKGAWSSWSSFYIRKAMLETLGLRKRPIEPAILSLDAPLSNDDAEEDALSDLIADDSLPDIDADILQRERARAVREAVSAVKGDAVCHALQRVYLDGVKRVEVARELKIQGSTLHGLLTRGKRELRRDWRLRRALDLDSETRFHAHKGVTAFHRDHTSVVEEAVIWRSERERRMHDKQNHKRKSDGGDSVNAHGKSGR